MDDKEIVERISILEKRVSVLEKKMVNLERQNGLILERLENLLTEIQDLIDG